MLGPTINHRRMQCVITQVELALKLRVTHSVIAKFERCKVGNRYYIPDAKMLRKLVDALFPDPVEREAVLAQWQYMAMVDRAQIEYDGFLERMKSNGIAIDLRQRMPARRTATMPVTHKYPADDPEQRLAAERKEEYNTGQPAKE